MAAQRTSTYNYGGQALIEGVMIRGSRVAAVAVRKPNGELVVYLETLNPLLYGVLGKIPFLRGITMLWDSLGLGFRALMYSADVATGVPDASMTKPIDLGTMGASLAFSTALVFLSPTVASGGAARQRATARPYPTGW
jgi:uncharacterized protein YqhQ